MLTLPTHSGFCGAHPVYDALPVLRPADELVDVVQCAERHSGPALTRPALKLWSWGPRAACSASGDSAVPLVDDAASAEIKCRCDCRSRCEVRHRLCTTTSRIAQLLSVSWTAYCMHAVHAACSPVTHHDPAVLQTLQYGQLVHVLADVLPPPDAQTKRIPSRDWRLYFYSLRALEAKAHVRPGVLRIFVAEGAVPLPADRQHHLGARLQAQRHHVHVAVVLVGQPRRRRVIEHNLSRRLAPHASITPSVQGESVMLAAEPTSQTAWSLSPSNETQVKGGSVSRS